MVYIVCTVQKIYIDIEILTGIRVINRNSSYLQVSINIIGSDSCCLCGYSEEIDEH